MGGGNILHDDAQDEFRSGGDVLLLRAIRNKSSAGYDITSTVDVILSQQDLKESSISRADALFHFIFINKLNRRAYGNHVQGK